MLSIVVELDVGTVLGPDTGPLLAVVGETVTSGGRLVRLERMGRPKIKYFILQDKIVLLAAMGGNFVLVLLVPYGW